MAMFTDWLSGRDDLGGRVVIDETGLRDRYDFALNWSPDENRNAMADGSNQGAGIAAAQDSPAGSIITAMQEQLGLRLESTRAKVDALVIDLIERPSEN